MTAARTPYELVSAVAPVHRAAKRELLLRTRALEREALREADFAFVYGCLQDVRYLTPRTVARYADLARQGTRTVLFARGTHASLAPGVLGVDLADEDPLADQWTVLLAGRRFACLAAQDLDEPVADDDDRSFTWALTEDPGVVASVFDLLSAVQLGRPSPGRRRGRVG